MIELSITFSNGVTISDDVANTIRNSSYYHIKHYGEIPVEKSGGEWIKDLESKKTDSRGKI